MDVDTDIDMAATPTSPALSATASAASASSSSAAASSASRRGPSEASPPAHLSERKRHHSQTRPSSSASTTGSKEVGVDKPKRSRVTVEQLQQLEILFAADRSPTVERRKEISASLGMQERQTQIWFQNRRAKEKVREGFIPKARRKRAAGQKALSSSIKNQVTPPMSPPELCTGFDSELHALINEEAPVTIIPCDTLTIGTWKRLRGTDASGRHSLVAYICDSQNRLSWFIQNSGKGFKMSIPFHTITSVEFHEYRIASPPVSPLTTEPRTMGPKSSSGVATFTLSQSPLFSFETSVVVRSVSSLPGIPAEETGGHSDDIHSQTGMGQTRRWRECHDWTENYQASRVFRHQLTGPPGPLAHFVRLISSQLFPSSLSASSTIAMPKPLDPTKHDEVEADLLNRQREWEGVRSPESLSSSSSSAESAAPSPFEYEQESSSQGSLSPPETRSGLPAAASAEPFVPALLYYHTQLPQSKQGYSSDATSPISYFSPNGVFTQPALFMQQEGHQRHLSASSSAPSSRELSPEFSGQSGMPAFDTPESAVWVNSPEGHGGIPDVNYQDEGFQHGYHYQGAQQQQSVYQQHHHSQTLPAGPPGMSLTVPSTSAIFQQMELGGTPCHSHPSAPTLTRYYTLEYPTFEKSASTTPTATVGNSGGGMLAPAHPHSLAPFPPPALPTLPAGLGFNPTGCATDLASTQYHTPALAGSISAEGVPMTPQLVSPAPYSASAQRLQEDFLANYHLQQQTQNRL